MSKELNSKTYIATFITSVCIQICTVVQGVLTARFLGVEGRGELAAVLLWPMFFSAIGLCGMYTVTLQTKWLGKKEVIYISLLTSLLSWVCCVTFLDQLLPQENKTILESAYVYSLVIFILQSSLNLAAILQREKAFKLLNLSRLINNIIIVVGLLILWLVNSITVFSVVGVYMIACIAVLAVRLSWTDNQKKQKKHRPDKYIRESFKVSMPYTFSNLFREGLLHADKVFLLWALGEESLGLWAVAITASGVLNTLFGAVGLVNVSKAVNCTIEESGPWLTHSFRVGLLFNLVIGIMLASLLPVLLPLVYGNPFSGAVLSAQILILAQVCISASSMFDQVLAAQKMPFVGVVIKIFVLILILTFAFSFYELMDLTTFAMIFMLAQALGLLSFIIVCLRIYPSTSRRDFFPGRRDAVEIYLKVQLLFWRLVRRNKVVES